MNKPAILKTLTEYFMSKGKILSIEEYKAATDAPMRFVVAKRAFGSWARLSQMVTHKMRVEATPMQAAPTPKAKPAPKKAETQVD